ncbi:MAG: anthranilate synthase component I, partial [Waterburya sp.]
MYLNHSYLTQGNILVSRAADKIAIDVALEEILFRLDSQRGGLLNSQYEYPGRYNRWAIGFVNPPLELTTRDRKFTLIAHNERGMVLLDYLTEYLSDQEPLAGVCKQDNQVFGYIKLTESCFSEEERSRQPSVFNVVREILHVFSSPEDKHLGLYGAFGYDLVFQFEQMSKQQPRAEDQRDLVLYLPDELLIVDYYQQQGYRL